MELYLPFIYRGVTVRPVFTIGLQTVTRCFMIRFPVSASLIRFSAGLSSEAHYPLRCFTFRHLHLYNQNHTLFSRTMKIFFHFFVTFSLWGTIYFCVCPKNFVYYNKSKHSIYEQFKSN